MRFLTLISTILLMLLQLSAQAQDLTTLPDNKLPQRVTQLEQQLEVLSASKNKASITASVNEINELKQQVKQLSAKIKEMQYQLDQLYGTPNTELTTPSDDGYLEDIDVKPENTPVNASGKEAPTETPVDLADPMSPVDQERFEEETKLVNEAEQLLQDKKFEEATAKLANKVDTMVDPDLAMRANIILGRALAGDGNYDQAASHLIAAFHRYPIHNDTPTVLLDLAKILNASGKPAQACATLNKLERKFNDLEHGIAEEITYSRKAFGCGE